MLISGILLVIVSVNCLGLLVGIVVVDWPGATALRRIFMRSLVLVLAKKLLIVPLLLPYFRLQQWGPAIFIVAVWYLQLNLLAGFMRLLILFVFVLVSFFEPGKAVLPSPLDSIDIGHASFIAFCLEQVEFERVARK